MKGAAAAATDAEADAAAAIAATDEGQDPSSAKNHDSNLSSGSPAEKSEKGGETSPPAAAEATVAAVRQE